MKLVVNFQELNTGVEHELFPRGENGYIVVLTPTHGEPRVYFNVTEVHWLFESGGWGDCVAIESDIHGQGFTMDVNRIDTLEVYEGYSRMVRFSLTEQ